MENALIALAPGIAHMVELGFIDTLWEWLTVIGVVTLGALGLLVGLMRGRGGSTRTLERDRVEAPPVEYQRRTTGGYTTAAGTKIDLDATREDNAGGGTTTIERPAPAPEPLPDLDEPVVVPDDLRDLETGPGQPTGEPLPQFERPAETKGRLRALRARLARSNNALGKALLGILSSGRLDEEAWEEVEDTLLASDLGIEATTELTASLRTKVAVEGSTDPEEVRGWLREDLIALVDPTMRRGIAARTTDGRPAVILVVGVNGTGKTTTVGKLARVLVADDRDVLLGAADTFRAAAADQLQTWGERVGVATIRADKEGADPASVAYEAVKAGQQLGSDVVVIDTAGRLHNKAGLMDELAKIKRVVEKLSPIDEVLLVLDATTGQNGMKQAEVFAQAVDVTGIVLTKLDGTAKGGIVVAVQRGLGVPVKLVGLGEGPDDLAPFIPDDFVDALLD